MVIEEVGSSEGKSNKVLAVHRAGIMINSWLYKQGEAGMPKVRCLFPVEEQS